MEQKPHSRTAGVLIRNLARDLRHEKRVCDAMAICTWLDLIAGPKSFLRQTAEGVTVRCVSHEDHNPSMSVTRGPDGTVRAKCFVCQFTGDAISLVRERRRISFREALAEIANFCGRFDLLEELEGRRPRTPRPPPPARPWPEPGLGTQIVAPETRHRVYSALLDRCPLKSQPDVAAYVRARGIYADAEAAGCGALPPRGLAQSVLLEELSRELGGREPLVDVGLANVGNSSQCWSSSHRLLIPWRSRSGEIATLQRRVIQGELRSKYLFPRGVPVPGDPFGADTFDAALTFYGDHVEVWFTEGALDALALRALHRRANHRLPRIILAVASASSLSSNAAAYTNARDVRVAFDADEPGDKAAASFITHCCSGANRVFRERPLNGKDACEVLARTL